MNSRKSSLYTIYADILFLLFIRHFVHTPDGSGIVISLDDDFFLSIQKKNGAKRVGAGETRSTSINFSR